MTCIEKCDGIEPVSSETVDAEHGQCDEGIASEHALASGRIEDETFWKLYMLSMVQTATINKATIRLECYLDCY